VERIDPVRFITNRSTGKMGYALAEAARDRGAEVALVSGPVNLDRPGGMEVVSVESSAQLCEAVLSRGASPRIVDICVRNGGEKVLRYQADGVVAATPTGSTAYALSAGGPVVDPALRCTLVTPICPHTLYSRSYLFGEDSALTLTATSPDGAAVQLTVDSEETLSLPCGTTVMVSPSQVQATLIQCKPHAFYAVLEHKLLTEEHQ
jgi:NAD+ kinase